MSNETNSIISLITEDKELITYRKSLRKIAGSVTATILLQQMMFRAKGKDVFYKFKEPCAHSLYKQGDSWTEELGFSAKEFDNALKKIGTKITGGSSKFAVMKKTDATGIIIYWTDAERVTWYQLNRDLLGKLLKGIYPVSDQREFTINPTEGDLPLVPETTPENTTEILPKPQNSKISPPEREQLNNLAEAIAVVCGNLDIEMIAPKTREALKTITVKLYQKEVTPADLTAFSVWWYDNTWQGQKSQPPTPQQLGDSWGQFDAARVVKVPNTSSNGSGFYV